MEMKVRLTSRDREMLLDIYRLGFFTANQITHIYWPDPAVSFDVRKNRAEQRIHKLRTNGYLQNLLRFNEAPQVQKVHAVYSIGKEGLRYFKELGLADPAHRPRKVSTAAWFYGRHTLIGNNLFAVLRCLERDREDLKLVSWEGERDCAYQVSIGSRTIKFNPDGLLTLSLAGGLDVYLYLEVDQGGMTRREIHRKVDRYLSFYLSGRYREIGLPGMPRLLWLACDRLRAIKLMTYTREACYRYSERHQAPAATEFRAYATDIVTAGLDRLDDGVVPDRILDPKIFLRRPRESTPAHPFASATAGSGLEQSA